METDHTMGQTGLSQRAAGGHHRPAGRWVLTSVLAGLLSLLATVGAVAFTYIQRPRPLPEIVPLPVNVSYRPHYLFSIYGADQPVGVTLSPTGDRIYVAETGRQRLVKIYDRDGQLLGSFSPPRTQPSQRSPVYLTTNDQGAVFVTDRLQHAIFEYNRDGAYLDTILDPELSLSEFVSRHVAGGLKPGETFAYNAFEPEIHCLSTDGTESTLPGPGPGSWSPLGVRFDRAGRMLVTDVSEGQSGVHELLASAPWLTSYTEAKTGGAVLGTSGQGNGQFLFPNAAVVDSQGRIYVSDGNNSRISVWDTGGKFLYHLGRGAGDGSLSLPRGAAIDGRDRLYVVDAVGQDVKVYLVSGSQPSYLFSFGDWGVAGGQFNYPNDIALDASGRLYIADRENNRIEVWSY